MPTTGEEAPRPPQAVEARTLIVSRSRGVLSTIDRQGGYPYGSFVEYAGRDDGSVVLLLSELARHTQNFTRDGRASLCVTAGREGSLSEARVTLVGTIDEVDDEALEGVRADYLDRHSHAERYADFGDFGFWRLDVERARYIAGFGRMSWIDEASWRGAEPDMLAESAAGIIAHMNEDHEHNMVQYARAFGDEHAWVEGAQMTGIDRLGFDLEVVGDERRESMRLSFDDPLERAAAIRGVMVELADRAREVLGEERG
jgi:hypothetical protein